MFVVVDRQLLGQHRYWTKIDLQAMKEVGNLSFHYSMREITSKKINA